MVERDEGEGEKMKKNKKLVYKRRKREKGIRMGRRRIK
jgi:hypothetical protein